MAATKWHLEGWHQSRPDYRDKKLSLAPMSLAPPPSDLRPLAQPVNNQKNLGACVAFGTGFVWGFEERQAEGPVEDVSFMKLYYDGRVAQGTVNQDSGLTVRGGFKAAAKNGLCHAHLCPYVPARFKAKPTMAAVADGLAHKPADKDYVSVKQDLIVLSNVLLKRPIAFGFTVPPFFMSNEMAKTGRLTLNDLGGTPVGGHCMALMGYDPLTDEFLVRNSWDVDWGVQGYCRLPGKGFVLSRDWCSDFWTAIRAASY